MANVLENSVITKYRSLVTCYVPDTQEWRSSWGWGGWTYHLAILIALG